MDRQVYFDSKLSIHVKYNFKYTAFLSDHVLGLKPILFYYTLKFKPNYLCSFFIIIIFKIDDQVRQFFFMYSIFIHNLVNKFTHFLFN